MQVAILVNSNRFIIDNRKRCLRRIASLQELDLMPMLRLENDKFNQNAFDPGKQRAAARQDHPGGEDMIDTGAFDFLTDKLEDFFDADGDNRGKLFPGIFGCFFLPEGAGVEKLLVVDKLRKRGPMNFFDFFRLGICEVEDLGLRDRKSVV